MLHTTPVYAHYQGAPDKCVLFSTKMRNTTQRSKKVFHGRRDIVLRTLNTFRQRFRELTTAPVFSIMRWIRITHIPDTGFWVRI